MTVFASCAAALAAMDVRHTAIRASFLTGLLLKYGRRIVLRNRTGGVRIVVKSPGQTMKALIREKFGTPDVLEVRDVPQPVPKAGEVLVRVRACSLNDWDWGLVRGPTFPWEGKANPRVRILGSDVAGEVMQVGPGVARDVVFRPGDRVYGDLCGRGGFSGFAEYVCAPERLLSPMSPRMSFVQAAALPHAGQL